MMNKRILFIGDSITECGRHEDQENLGNGYVRILHDYFVTNFPKIKFDMMNQGVGGNRIIDLEERWERDVISLAPNIISISIGINDVWRQLDSPGIDQIYPEDFERIYTGLLEQVISKLNAIIVLMEPTIIEEEVHSIGNEKLKAYVEIVQKLADKYQAILVPTHQCFIQYLKSNGSYGLTMDGVHMNSAGNMLMATKWLEATKDKLNL
ncbi:SGNH/GDSL hydrolase family protein [Oceanobacillus bengalensis]|uniref:Hydrolase n=1 Tax=Oceanobacillus bengalensis TaxID=1435466 RepID=A0A494YZQ9_9BACI|nr:SGNH/GDSL hydrolase family protein [Oceanobacillus bengalensis]RKQ15673.1 hydrolase [Oceanobacillus bengalensis]